MEHNNIQPNNTYNASFAPNTAAAASQQQAQPQAEPIPPLANAPDLSAHSSARNLQEYNTISTPQGSTDGLATDPWNVPEYQPIQPGAPYLEKLADEAMNTKKATMLLKHARENEELGDFKDAEEAYEKALKYTEHAEHYQLYAACLREIYLRFSQALEKDEAKERLYREKASKAFYYLGDLYQKQAALQDAQNAYRASCDLALHEAPLKALVDVARQLEETVEIVTALEKLADFYVEKGAIDLAIDRLKEALELGKSFAILDKLEALYAQTGGEDSQLKVDKTRILRFELQVQTLQQKVVKQKTKIGGLKQTIHSQDGKLETLEKQVEFLNRQVIHLNFSHCPVMQDADFIPLLMHNPYVQSLNLAGCEHLTDAVLRVLPERLSNLQELNLTRCKGVTEAGLYAIVEKATKLKRLTLDYCPGTTITVLHKLNKKQIVFTIEGVAFKKNVLDLSQHKYSYISDKNLEDTELLKALEDNLEITELNLSNCTKITDAGLAPLKGFQWLTSLNLSLDLEIINFGLHSRNFDQLSDACLRHLRGLTQLTELDLSSRTRISDTGLEHLRDLTRLTELDLSFCDKLTDAGLRQLAGLIQLKSLNLTNTQLSDVGLEHLASLTQLTALYLNGCDKFTDAGLERLTGLSRLTDLNLNDCAYRCGLTAACKIHLAQ